MSCLALPLLPFFLCVHLLYPSCQYPNLDIQLSSSASFNFLFIFNCLFLCCGQSDREQHFLHRKHAGLSVRTFEQDSQIRRTRLGGFGMFGARLVDFVTFGSELVSNSPVMELLTTETLFTSLSSVALCFSFTGGRTRGCKYSIGTLIMPRSSTGQSPS